MQLNRLTALKVAALTKDGIYCDGAGLYLRVRGSAKHWLFVYQWQGKRKEMGLGASPYIKLAKARERADAAGTS